MDKKFNNLKKQVNKISKDAQKSLDNTAKTVQKKSEESIEQATKLTNEAVKSVNKVGKDISNVKAPKIDLPKIEPITLEDTIIGDIKKQGDKQNKLFEQQIKILVKHNDLLTSNYNKLEEMYNAQVQAYQESNEELRKSRNYNRWMMAIAIIAMLAAIAGPIVTIIVSK